MRKTVMVGALMLMMPLLVLGQMKDKSKPTQNKAAKTDGIEQQIMLIEEEWEQASRNKINPEMTLIRILANDWFFTDPHGRIQNREQVIETIKSNSDSIERTEFFDVKVRVYGDTAVATGGANEIGKRADGKPYTEGYMWMDVFVKRKGRWQAVVSQATLLPSSSTQKK